jgi:hypothetical protein
VFGRGWQQHHTPALGIPREFARASLGTKTAAMASVEVKHEHDLPPAPFNRQIAHLPVKHPDRQAGLAPEPQLIAASTSAAPG